MWVHSFIPPVTLFRGTGSRIAAVSCISTGLWLAERYTKMDMSIVTVRKGFTYIEAYITAVDSLIGEKAVATKC